MFFPNIKPASFHNLLIKMFNQNYKLFILNKTHIEGVFKRTSASESDVNLFFVLEKSFKDASVNVLLSLVWSSRDRIELFEDCDVVWSAVIEVDGKKRNTGWWKFIFDPSECGNVFLAGAKTFNWWTGLELTVFYHRVHNKTFGQN